MSIETEKKCYPPTNVEDFWSLEAIGINDSPVGEDDDLALKQFYSTLTKKESRYYASWSFKTGIPDLADNYELCYLRLKSVIKRLKDNRGLLLKYDGIFKEQESKGIIEEILPEKETSLVHYLSRHPVITPAKTTNKVRVVYDASSKARKELKSLNECLYRGPVLLPNLCGVLLRFRMHRTAVTNWSL